MRTVFVARGFVPSKKLPKPPFHKLRFAYTWKVVVKKKVYFSLILNNDGIHR